jgi:hypothetical protein
MHVLLTTGFLFFIALTLTLHTSTYVFAQNTTLNVTNGTAVNKSIGNQSNAANMSAGTAVNQSIGNQSNAGAIGSSEQLSQVLGNNTQLIENKTAIGNTPGPIGNLTASTNTTLGQIGQNASESVPGVLNKTGEVAKKIIGGAADVVTNITAEIKKGVGAK